MANRTAKKTVEQAIKDFDDIKEAIIGHRVPVPYATPTSMYAPLIANIRIGSIAGMASCCTRLRVYSILSGTFIIYPKSDIVETITGKAEFIDEEE